MFSNRLALVVLGVACVTAAGGGAYLATRQNDVPVAEAPAVAQEASISTPVAETEALIEATPPPVESPAPVSELVVAPKAPTAPARQPDPARKAPVQSAQTRIEPPPALERNRPAAAVSNTTSTTSAVDALPPVEPPPVTRTEELRAAEPARAPEPPRPTFHDVVVSADSVLGLQLETTVSSEKARIEDRVDARVVRDVRVGGDVAIPAGSRAIGSVTAVERGGKMKERARVGLRFHTLVLADGTELPITSETIYRNGDAPANGSAAKIGGGAVAGAILGAIIGGAKGAAIGGSAGAGAGTAAVMAGERSVASFPTGSEVTARIVSPVTVTVEK
jgi:hypothetical protein